MSHSALVSFYDFRGRAGARLPLRIRFGVTDEVLNDFIDAEASDRSADVRASRVVRELLVFEFGQDRFAVDATCVEGSSRGRRLREFRVLIREFVASFKIAAASWSSWPTLPACRRRTRPTASESWFALRRAVHRPTGHRNDIGGAVELLAIPTPLSIHDSKLGAFTYLGRSATAWAISKWTATQTEVQERFW